MSLDRICHETLQVCSWDKNGCGPSNGARIWGLEVQNGRWLLIFTPMATFRVTAVQGGVRKLYRCVVEIKMKVEYENGCGTSKGAEVGSEEDYFVTTTPLQPYKVRVFPGSEWAFGGCLCRISTFGPWVIIIIIITKIKHQDALENNFVCHSHLLLIFPWV